MKKKGLEYAEPVLTVEHKGEHFSFTKVTSPLGSVTSVVCGFESRRPHQKNAPPNSNKLRKLANWVGHFMLWKLWHRGVFRGVTLDQLWDMEIQTTSTI